ESVLMFTSSPEGPELMRVNFARACRFDQTKKRRHFCSFRCRSYIIRKGFSRAIR
ncbi:hypothetical protein L9F63_020641, partial [Diploptera punctata]